MQNVYRRQFLVSLLGCSTLTISGVVLAADRRVLDTKSLPLVLPETISDPTAFAKHSAQFLLSEKLDGVRAYWSGEQLYFRSGRAINAPSWFTAGFPKHELDGELWMGRASFDKLSAIVRRQAALDAEWRQVQYCLFESPHAPGTFRERIDQLTTEVNQLQIPWLRVIPQEPVSSFDQIQLKLRELVAQQAEGLVLHRADAPFEIGRTEFAYKLKPQLDTEAKVVGIQAGKGKYQGKMGALILETKEGKRFKLGTGFDDETRLHPPQLQSWVTYRYRDLTGTGLPKFASFLRVYVPE